MLFADLLSLHPVTFFHVFYSCTCIGHSQETGAIYVSNLLNSLPVQTVTHDVEVVEPLEKPICWQATRASVEPNESSHTVPHCPLM